MAAEILIDDAAAWLQVWRLRREHGAQPGVCGADRVHLPPARLRAPPLAVIWADRKWMGAAVRCKITAVCIICYVYMAERASYSARPLLRSHRQRRHRSARVCQIESVAMLRGVCTRIQCYGDPTSGHKVVDKRDWLCSIRAAAVLHHSCIQEFMPRKTSAGLMDHRPFCPQGPGWDLLPTEDGMPIAGIPHTLALIIELPRPPLEFPAVGSQSYLPSHLANWPTDDRGDN